MEHNAIVMIAEGNNDTICAISTPNGTGGIAVIRVSGPEALKIVDSVWHGKKLSEAKSHTAHLGELCQKSKDPIDQCVATIYRGPNSYTGEDVVELSVHGSKWVQRETLRLFQSAGCRMAEAGEFTRRAVVNGRMDLTQAEGVADLIASSSRAAHRIALKQLKGGIARRLTMLRQQLVNLSALLELELDFSEEEVQFADRKQLIDTALQVRNEIQRLHVSYQKGSAIKDGIPVAIIGNTNVGKSSLMNALLDDDRSIVSDIHGTTRDTIEETLEIGDYLYRFIDTAGLRQTEDPIEKIGIERTHYAIRKADIIIYLTEATATIDWDYIDELRNTVEASTAIVLGINKIDLISDEEKSKLQHELEDRYPGDSRINPVLLSVKRSQGIDTLTKMLDSITREDESFGDQDSIITNLRQAQALGEALKSINPLIDGLRGGLETELVAQHLRETIQHLSSITGDIPTTEILQTIFKNFCIGK